MENSKKLYKVTLRGMTYNSTGVVYGVSFVVAETTDEAYKRVREFLDKHDIGFSRDRELDHIQLIAENYQYTHVEHLLFL